MDDLKRSVVTLTPPPPSETAFWCHHRSRARKVTGAPRNDRPGQLHRPQLQQWVVAHYVIFFEGVVRSALPPSSLIFFAVYSIVSTWPFFTAAGASASAFCNDFTGFSEKDGS